MSIQVYREKIKAFLAGDTAKDLSIVAVILIVAFGSFGLGRLSKNEGSVLAVEPGNMLANQTAQAIVPEIAPVSIATPIAEKAHTTGDFVASKRGKKYYSLGCSGVKNLLEANKIYFATKQEAEQAGYTKSASCPDL